MAAIATTATSVRTGLDLVAPLTGVVFVAVSRSVSFGPGCHRRYRSCPVTTAAPAAGEPVSSDGFCVMPAPAKRAAPILRGSRPGSGDLPIAQRFPLAAGDERAPIAITLQITFDFSALLSVNVASQFGGEWRLQSENFEGETGAVCAPLPR